MKADRVVCDTNVLISAAIMPLGKPKAVVSRVVASGRLILSRRLYDEFVTHLARPKFSKYIDDEQREAFLLLLEAVAEFVEISGARLGVRDPDYDKILETTIVGAAELESSRR